MRVDLVYATFLKIVLTPLENPEMVWIALPLVITLVLMELYFSRYRDEKFEGSSTVTNSLVFVFVGIDLLRTVIGSRNLVNYSIKYMLSVSILGVGAVFTFISFFHDLSFLVKKLTSFLIVNTVTYLVIVAVYGDFVIDVYYIVSSVLFIFFVWLFFWLFHFVVPKGH